MLSAVLQPRYVAVTASYIAITPYVDAKTIGVVCIIMTTNVIIVASGFAGSFSANPVETHMTWMTTTVAIRATIPCHIGAADVAAFVVTFGGGAPFYSIVSQEMMTP